MSIGPILVRTIRHFFPEFNDWLDQFPDHRAPERVIYHRRFLLWIGLFLFLGKLGGLGVCPLVGAGPSGAVEAGERPDRDQGDEERADDDLDQGHSRLRPRRPVDGGEPGDGPGPPRIQARETSSSSP